MTKMKKDIRDLIIAKIKEYSSIVIYRHYRPDGDAIGSAKGLKEIIKTSFPEKEVYTVSSDSSQSLAFLGEDDKVSEDKIKESLVIVVDTGDKTRVSGASFLLGKEIIKIDHHETSEDFGSINYVEEKMASCSDVICDLVMAYKKDLIINKLSASLLFIGIVSDSGRFRYESSDSLCHLHASYLLEQNIDSDKIFSKLYVESKERFELKKVIYNNYKFTRNGVAYIYFKKGSAKKYNCTSEDLSSCINMLENIKGSMIWLLFNENNENIRVRLRSRFIPITSLAEKYNGGGHTYACGATLKNKHEFQSLLKDADALLEEYKLNHPEDY